jgi:hypothetical protein
MDATDVFKLPDIHKSYVNPKLEAEILPDSDSGQIKDTLEPKITEKSFVKSKQSSSDSNDYNISCDSLNFSEKSMKNLENIDQGLIHYHKEIK